MLLGVAVAALSAAPRAAGAQEVSTTVCDDTPAMMTWILRWAPPHGAAPADQFDQERDTGDADSGCQEWEGVSFRADFAPEVVGTTRVFDEFYFEIRHLTAPHGERPDALTLIVHLNANFLGPQPDFGPVPDAARQTLASIPGVPQRLDVPHGAHRNVLTRFDYQTVGPADAITAINFRLVAEHSGTVVPEPATTALTAAGLAGLVGLARRRRRAS